MALSKSKIINTLFASVSNYENHLNNKNFMFIYQINQNQFEFLEVGFEASHFKHLTGVNSDFTAKHFYKLCLKKKLSPHAVAEKENGTTALKLKILPQLPALTQMSVMVGEFGNYRIHLEADHVLGTTNQMSLALKTNKNYSIPISLLQTDIRQQTKKAYPVIAIYSKKISDPLYDTVSFFKPTISITSFPECIISKLDHQLFLD